MKFYTIAMLTILSLSKESMADKSLRGSSQRSLAADEGNTALGTQKSGKTVNIYRGYKHDWQRNVAGFRTPHRISFLETAIEDDTFKFGQITGVDGNYQKPVGYYTTINPSEDIISKEGTVKFEWDDKTDGGEFPQANTIMQKQIIVNIDDVSKNDTEHAVFLQGIKINSSCDDSKQPGFEECNSNGFWPWKIGFNIHECEVDDDNAYYICQLTVEINRAWTPNKGGVPGIEEKPLNEVLSYEVDVNYGYLSGQSEKFSSTNGAPVTSRGSARSRTALTSTQSIVGKENMSQGTVAMAGMEFTFKKTGNESRHNHLGRYINTLFFRLEDNNYDSESGSLNYRWTNHVDITDTGAASDVEYKITPLMLQFNDDSTIDDSGTASGHICVNSSPQAPAFSAWNRCTRPTFPNPFRGPEQMQDSARLN